MKRKSPFFIDFLKPTLEINEQSSNIINENCTKMLNKPLFLKIEKFSETVLKIPLFLLKTSSLIGFNKQIQCNLLPGSQLEANNLFGMEIERSSHIKQVEQNNIRFNIKLEKYIHHLCLSQIDLIIFFKNGEITQNGKKVKRIPSISFNISNNTLFLKFNSKEQISSMVFESDIPVVFDEGELSIHSLRLTSPEFQNQSNIICNHMEIFTISEFSTFSSIKCNDTLMIRTESIIVKSDINAKRVIMICDDMNITKSKIIAEFTSLYSKNYIKTSLSHLNFRYCFIKSNKIDLLNKGSFTSENICFIQTEEIIIGQSIKSSICNIETRDLTILKTGKIDITNKMNLFFISNNSKNQKSATRKNEGVFIANNLFFEINSLNNTDVNNETFQNFNAFSVKCSFLLSSGTFLNKRNVSFRSFYLSSYSNFISQMKSSIKIGDLLVTESSSNIKIEENAEIIPFVHLKPIILNSGKFFNGSTCDIECTKFITNGEINGCFNIKAADIISILGNSNECSVLNCNSSQIAIVNGTTIAAFKCIFTCLSFEICNSVIKPSNSNNDDEKSSFELYYKDTYLNNNGEIKFFKSKSIQKVENIEIICNNRSEPINAENSNTKYETPKEGSKRKVPSLNDS